MFQAAHRSSSGALSLQPLVFIRMWWPAVVKSEWELPIINSISDHDAQLLTISNSSIKRSSKIIHKLRWINYTSLTSRTYTCNVSTEVWDDIFVNKDINIIFKSFLLTFLRLIYTYFPFVTISNKKKDTGWLTANIKTLQTSKNSFIKKYIWGRENNISKN
jgi:hypothetical protein